MRNAQLAMNSSAIGLMSLALKRRLKLNRHSTTKKSQRAPEANGDKRGQTNRVTKLTCGRIAAGLPPHPKSPQQASS